MAQADAAIEEIMVGQKFGQAGRQVVIQELLEGMVFSLHAICDGTTAKLFPTAQDHKRLGENDAGPNTGGMGRLFADAVFERKPARGGRQKNS